ncbi:hypothetical protein [Novosphingobium sp. Gsoil 351]|uniref:hypothetical protein n=1 Tax=Novosphingobium sp. Gsoil 351 TaxID=2675225 RepID=UPI001E4B543B|nr:hypothetical protein [Novosphingobium sp. Gsoil 351]
MDKGLDRRTALKRAAAGAMALALPARVFAQPYSIPEQNRRILDIARREVDRAGNILWRRDIAGVADFGLPLVDAAAALRQPRSRDRALVPGDAWQGL